MFAFTLLGLDQGSIRLFAFACSAMSQQSVSPAELEAELRKLLESTLTMGPGRKTPAASTLPPPTLSPETKAALLLEIAQVHIRAAQAVVHISILILYTLEQAVALFLKSPLCAPGVCGAGAGGGVC